MWERAGLSHRPQTENRGGAQVGHKHRDSPQKVLSSLFCLLPESFYSGALLHIDCSGSLQVDNCKGILLYNENAVEFDMDTVRVRVSGDALALETVEKGILLLRGRIFRLDFFYGGRENGSAASVSQGSAGRGGDDDGGNAV